MCDSVVRRIEGVDPLEQVSSAARGIWQVVDWLGQTFMGRAIGFGFVVVVAYAIIRWTSPGLYWVEFVLLVATVVGIGAVVAHADGGRPFLTAAIASFLTLLCIEYLALFTGPAWARPEVLPSPVTMILVMVPVSLVVGAMTGGVALGLRSVRTRRRTGR
jgi:hypothetical protein